MGGMFSNQFITRSITVLRDNHTLIRQGFPRLISGSSVHPHSQCYIEHTTSRSLQQCYIEHTTSRSLQQWKNQWSYVVHSPIMGISHWGNLTSRIYPRLIRLHSTSHIEDQQGRDIDSSGEQLVQLLNVVSTGGPYIII